MKRIVSLLLALTLLLPMAAPVRAAGAANPYDALAGWEIQEVRVRGAGFYEGVTVSVTDGEKIDAIVTALRALPVEPNPHVVKDEGNGRYSYVIEWEDGASYHSNYLANCRIEFHTAEGRIVGYLPRPDEAWAIWLRNRAALVTDRETYRAFYLWLNDTLAGEPATLDWSTRDFARSIFDEEGNRTVQSMTVATSPGGYRTITRARDIQALLNKLYSAGTVTTDHPLYYSYGGPESRKGEMLGEEYMVATIFFPDQPMYTLGERLNLFQKDGVYWLGLRDMDLRVDRAWARSLLELLDSLDYPLSTATELDEEMGYGRYGTPWWKRDPMG